MQQLMQVRTSESCKLIGYRLRGPQCVTTLSNSVFSLAQCQSSAMLEREPGHAPNMSGITANDACNDCLSSAQHLNCTEIHSHSHIDEDDELLKYIWREYLHPKQYEWVLIAGYIIVFLVSLVGNTLGK